MIGVGMPAWVKLNWFGREVWNAFGSPSYLVGSAAKGKEWRDVDVRLILPDEEFVSLLGERTKPAAMNPRWSAYCLAFSALGREMTGLPIDFQIDPESLANEMFDNEVRVALGIIGR